MSTDLQSKVDLLKDLLKQTPLNFPFTAIEDVDHKDGVVRVLSHICMGSAGVVKDGIFIDHGSWEQQKQLSELLQTPIKICFVMGKYYTLADWDKHCIKTD